MELAIPATMAGDKTWLKSIVVPIRNFLKEKLSLELHPDKIFIRTLNSGIDFLGWVNFSDHRVLRTTTKKRMLKNIEINNSWETVNSYLGLLRHGNARKLKNKIIRSAI